MLKTHAKIDSMSTADWQQYHQLLTNYGLMEYFADEIMRFSRTMLKPDEVLRRFSLNGDGQLDLKEFQLAVKRLGIVASSSSSADDSQQQQEFNCSTRSKELYSVFCPSQTRKLDIDMFCRIMTEWSLQLMRVHHHQQPTTTMPFSKSNWLAHEPPRNSVTPLAAPYATENRPGSRGRVSNTSSTMFTDNGNNTAESEMLWRRIADTIGRNMDKLSQIFFKMDIACSGSVSLEEFELAMNHIGIFLTRREYDTLYDSLGSELKDFQRIYSDPALRSTGTESGSFGIKYADFLALFRGSQQQPLPSTSTKASPPVVGVGSARLWDLLVASLDKLQPIFQQYERINQRYVSPDIFRDCLLRCGIVLSNADYAALRVRLLPFSDSLTGSIGLTPLIQALKASDHTVMPSSTTISPASPLPTKSGFGISPIRTGRKTVFYPPGNTSCDPSLPVAMPAGKSNEERNAEANRTIVKIRDENRWKSDLNMHQGCDKSKATDNDSRSNDSPFSSKPHVELERRILNKLQQLKALGQLGACSPQTIFPGDRFGHITRGQFRQSLVHLGVLARYAEVETLFWTLDPNGRGYIVNQDFYDHLNAFSTRSSSGGPSSGSAWNLPFLDSSTSPTSGRMSRSVQKVLEGMLVQFPLLYSICQRIDFDQTGLISPPQLLAAIQELGILASVSDTQTAIYALCNGMDITSAPSDAENGMIPYKNLEGRLSQLCSDLLSPKKRRKHLSTASVLLAPQEEPYRDQANEYSMNTVSETDALWNCPRRRMNHDHRATKTSIRITDELDPGYLQSATRRSDSQQRGTTNIDNEIDKRDRINRLALISILQDLLERRSDLKSVMDLHRRADMHGQVTKDDLIDILLASRLNLNFSNSSSGISVREFVDILYPSSQQGQISVGFLDLLHRINDLLTDVTRQTASSTTLGYPGSNTTTSRYQEPRQTSKKIQSYATSGISRQPYYSAESPGVSGLSEEASVRRKLLCESRLKDLLPTDHGRQSAAILVRHAFKGLTSREMIVPIENGQFEAICRSSDIKHVCYRLGLDLEPNEQQFVAQSIDTNNSGFISSPQLLQFFVQLALLTNGGNHTPPRVATPPSRDQYVPMDNSPLMKYQTKDGGYSPINPYANASHERRQSPSITHDSNPVQAG